MLLLRLEILEQEARTKEQRISRKNSFDMCGQAVNSMREIFRDGLAISSFVWGVRTYKQTEAGNYVARLERRLDFDQGRIDFARMEKLAAEGNAHLSELRKNSEKSILSRFFISSKANDVKNKNKDSTK